MKQRLCSRACTF